MKNLLFPINKMTAVGMSKGINFELIIPLNIKHSVNHTKLPLNVRSLSYGEKRAKEFIDYTGYQFGWFTVIGLYDEPINRSKNQNCSWVCKCACGNYETRKSRAIKKNANEYNQCWECRNTLRLRNKKKH